jgi:hypothetical protein
MASALTTYTAFENIGKTVNSFSKCLCCVMKKKQKTEHDPKKMFICCGYLEGEFKSKKQQDEMQTGCIVCEDCAFNDDFEGGRDLRTGLKWCKVCAVTSQAQAREWVEMHGEGKRIPGYITNRANHTLKQIQRATGGKELSAIRQYAEEGRNDVSSTITSIEKERDLLRTKLERMEVRQASEAEVASQQDAVVQQIEEAQIGATGEQTSEQMSLEESEAANLASLARNDAIADQFDKQAAQLGEGEPTEWLDFCQQVQEVSSGEFAEAAELADKAMAAAGPVAESSAEEAATEPAEGADEPTGQEEVTAAGLLASLTEPEGDKNAEQEVIMSEVANAATPSSIVGDTAQEEPCSPETAPCDRRNAAAESSRSAKASALVQKTKRALRDDGEQNDEVLPGSGKKKKTIAADSSDDEDEQPLANRAKGGKGAAAESSRSSQAPKAAPKAASKAASKATGKRKQPEKDSATYGQLEVQPSKARAYQKFLASGKSDQDWEKQETDKKEQALKAKADKQIKIDTFDDVVKQRDEAWAQLEKEKNAKKDAAKKVKNMVKALDKLSDMLVERGGDADEIAKLVMDLTAGAGPSAQ